jgi:hypothetical protein
MEPVMTFDLPYDIYGTNNPINFTDLNNKLFCTFTTLEGVNDLVDSIQRSYTVMYSKIFVLEVKNNNEYVLTYNIEMANIASIPENTILVHRKKESNTLYTINALNELIKSLNGGVVDTRFQIDWQHYKNTILLTQQNELKQLKTKIHEIIELIAWLAQISFVHLASNINKL